MRQETINIYRFSELSEKAQRRAWENGPDFSGDYDDDFINTLDAFERIFDIDVWDYRVGDCIYSPHYKYTKAGAACDCPDGDPIRVAKYMWNNYAEYITKGKYYSRGRWIDGQYQHKSRNSKATFELDNCPLTGCCYDMDILGPVLDCLHYKRFFNSIDDLFQECLTHFFRVWDAEKEYYGSIEHFAEMADCNDFEFLETGDMWK